ncbi:MAG: hypothetical protein ABIM74_01380, partial [candidate division WOR-3 bacterium]
MKNRKPSPAERAKEFFHVHEKAFSKGRTIHPGRLESFTPPDRSSRPFLPENYGVFIMTNLFITVLVSQGLFAKSYGGT